ncbi:MAG: glycosyl transferase family 1 [Planctomycetota bacterium]|nr:MAG: glycosyl transferase family 1 [Planctomycetota bacterium]
MSKIGLVVHGQPPELVGGTERQVAALAELLADAGHELQVFSGSIEWRPDFEVVELSDGRVPVRRVHRNDLFFERWDKLENPNVERAYGDWLADFRPDLVHVHHWARLTTTLVRTANDQGIPAVVTLHDLFSSCPRYHRVKEDLTFCEETPSVAACSQCAPRWLFQGDQEIHASLEVFVDDLREELSAAAALLAPTAGHGERLLSWLGLQRPMIELPPPGSGLGAQAAPATRPLGARIARPGDPLRVGVFGHLHPLKGVEMLLRAQAALLDPGAIELHVWGDPPDEATGTQLHALAGNRPVIWHGAFAPSDLSGAPVDVIALPTLCAESYSFTLDEACELGVPVVATDLGALRDRATDRLCLVPRADEASWGRTLIELGADPQRRARMAAAAPPSKLDDARHLAELQRVYAEVLGQPRPPVRPRDERALRRREHAHLLRERGLHELLRSEGWERVVADLQSQLAKNAPAE